MVNFDKKEFLENDRTIDDKITIEKKDQDQVRTYRALSKNFKNVDPNLRDHKSIQHQGLHDIFFIIKKFNKWQFPSVPLVNNMSIIDFNAKNLKKPKSMLKIIIPKNYPYLVQRKDIDKEEIDSNQLYGKCEGKKIFFIKAYHFLGKMEWDGVEDWAWVTKFEMNQFFDELEFNFFQNVA